jgi:hypothetical protein
MIGYAAAALAYFVPTFALGFVWHLVWFDAYYRALAIYRPDVIVPFGFAAIAIQGMLFAVLYDRAFAPRGGPPASRTLAYAATGALLSWSFTTLAVAAKNVMASVPDYLLIETAFTVVQWAMVAPLTALAWARFGRPRAAGPVA